jgi:hypothetical protein
LRVKRVGCSGQRRSFFLVATAPVAPARRPAAARYDVAEDRVRVPHPSYPRVGLCAPLARALERRRNGCRAEVPGATFKSRRLRVCLRQQGAKRRRICVMNAFRKYGTVRQICAFDALHRGRTDSCLRSCLYCRDNPADPNISCRHRSEIPSKKCGTWSCNKARRGVLRIHAAERLQCELVITFLGSLI